jgi:hypothetical protein
VALAALIVAIVGTAVNFAWTVGWSLWHHRATTRPRVHVTGTFALSLGSREEEIFAIRALNVGSVPVTLKTAFVQHPGPNRSRAATFASYTYEAPPLACVVHPGHDWEGSLPAERFRHAVQLTAGEDLPPWRVRVGVKDAAGELHVSDDVVVDRGPEAA